MATSEHTTGTRDEQYKVISILYHALQGAETCATYLQDAEQAGDQDLVQRFREVQGRYRQLADRGRRSCGSGSGRGVELRSERRHEGAAASASGVRRRRAGSRELTSSEGWAVSTCRRRTQPNRRGE
jgi:hypothetical protein